MGGRADDDTVANGNSPTSHHDAKLNACRALQVFLKSQGGSEIWKFGTGKA